MPVKTDAVAYLDRVRASLSDAYTVEERRFEDDVLVIARRSDTRLQWAGARLSTTMALRAFDTGADQAQLDRYLAAVVREASSVVKAKGMQRGGAAIAVAVFDAAAADALTWARVAHGHQFAIAGYPVVVDLATASVIQPERMRAGGLFRRFLHRTTDEALGPPLAGA